MREIKFRARHIKDKKYYNVLELNLDSRLVIIKSDKPNIMKEALRFDEIILEQYTGLKDKNGVEIYEGDIVVNKDVLDTYAPYHKKMFPTKKDFADYYTVDIKIDLDYGLSVDVKDINEYLIIGNIHERGQKQ